MSYKEGGLSDKEIEGLIKIEELEHKYLDKYYHFLKFAEDEMLLGFQTKEKIRDDWYHFYDQKISDFSVGAERIVYSLLNGKGIGQPNSAPVGSDLFFETHDAYIHIDLKTVQISNSGDFNRNIFVGGNQNSYSGYIEIRGKAPRYYESSLPAFYLKGKDGEKICLSYFITILYEPKNIDILVISIMCMPNGELEKYYGTRVLQAGKTPDEARFNFKEVSSFELLGDGKSKRVKVVYYNSEICKNYEHKLSFYKELYENSKK